MENHLSVFNLTDTLFHNGYRNLAFAGEPDTPYRIMHVRTALMFRESTEEFKLQGKVVDMY